MRRTKMRAWDYCWEVSKDAHRLGAQFLQLDRHKTVVSLMSEISNGPLTIDQIHTLGELVAAVYWAGHGDAQGIGLDRVS